ncbi:hypothetical protein DPMN_032635 [Dreissena polymorpha]|uniref:Uncharacterized protein n=1 Tax=Dreissena polymorpha TaxID=45954 RepID=A0A9D4M4J5_DREPO|nr:hypothetical protein DPMN_032635 [Dreissena polymorpha]
MSHQRGPSWTSVLQRIGSHLEFDYRVQADSYCPSPTSCSKYYISAAKLAPLTNCHSVTTPPCTVSSPTTWTLILNR